MLINAARGLGASIAQGEVVPDRYVLTRSGALKESGVGLKYRHMACVHSASASRSPMFASRCLEDHEIVELGSMMKRAEQVIGQAVEIEWAADDESFKLLQARPLVVQPAAVPDEIWLRHPRLAGHPAGVGWGTGRACVINCECELARVGPGDVLVTTVAGPALAEGTGREHLAPGVAGPRTRSSDGAGRVRRDAAHSRWGTGGRGRRRGDRALDEGVIADRGSAATELAQIRAQRQSALDMDCAAATSSGVQLAVRGRANAAWCGTSP